MTSAARLFWIILALILFLSRSAHVNILWADEDYHLAAAVQILHGKMLYRDVWYDKPPLNALLFTVFGAWPGWPLRIFQVLLELATAAVAFRFASKLWNPRAGFAAATLYVFFQIFYFAHTVIPLEPDSLAILPQFAAVYLAWRERSAWAGAVAGVAFLLNTKGLFILAACIALHPAGWLAMLVGFAAPVLAGAASLASQGAFGGYIEQVWRWGFLYASDPPVEPATAPLLRFASWQAFHGALWLCAILGLTKIADKALRWKLVAWLAISVAAACVGWRLLPRYFDQVIPPLVILGSFGFLEAARRTDWRTAVLAIALVVPALRFAPRYVYLLADNYYSRPQEWDDAAMDAESRAGAKIVREIARSGDTIFVWGYRPNVVVYSRLPVADRLWDSQPVTMVPADRHLRESTPLEVAWSRENQRALANTLPTILVDGLSAYNPSLDIHNFPALADWLARYCAVGTAGRGMTIYKLCDSATSPERE